MREARRRFGNRTAQREQTRDADVALWFESVAGDIRYALRSLRATPGFTAVAVLSLALGIGANTAIFSLINSVMLRSLPVSHPEQLIQIGEGQGGKVQNNITTNPIWEYIRDHQDFLAGAAAFSQSTFELSTGGESRPITGSYVSGDFFRVLGVQSIVGRPLTVDDDHRGCAATTVLSAAFWRSRYGADPAIVGRTLTINGKPFQVVGVMQPGFTGIDVGVAPEFYVPICAQAALYGDHNALDGRSNWWLRMLARNAGGLVPPRSMPASIACPTMSSPPPYHRARRSIINTSFSPST